MLHKKVRKRPSGRVWLTPKLRRTIRSEAHLLGLTPAEYMRLTVALSSSLRQSFIKEKRVDAKTLLSTVENPMFRTLLVYLSEATMQAKDGEADHSTDSKPAPHTPPPADTRQPVARPHQPVHVPPTWQVPPW